MPLTPFRRGLILALVSSALFLIVIDMTVLYTALPRLAADLNASAVERLWIVNAYGLVVAGLLPGAGALGDRLGHKPLFLAGLGVFGGASVVAAFAPTPGVLIAARALLALGAALMMPATLSILRHTFPDERERGLAIGIWSAIASGGAMLGPVIGGLLLSSFWWGSVFLINVPVVLLVLGPAWALVPADTPRSDRPWDRSGSILILLTLVAGAYALKEASRQSPAWDIVALAVAVCLLAGRVFVRHQRRHPHPLIDFSLFRDRAFSGGVLAALAVSIALVGGEFVFVQYLQLVEGLSPLDAALRVLPLAVASLVAGPLAGLALAPLGTSRVMMFALALAAMGSALLGFGVPLAGLALLGFGFGATATGASSAILTGAPPARSGMAASIEEVAYELGGAIGVAVLGCLMAVLYAAHLPLAATVSPVARDGLDEALRLAATLPPAEGEALIAAARAAFAHAFQGVMLICTGLLALSALVLRRLS